MIDFLPHFSYHDMHRKRRYDHRRYCYAYEKMAGICAGGSIAAARATTAGKVSQVLVKPGDKIEAQQVVAKVSE